MSKVVICTPIARAPQPDFMASLMGLMSVCSGKDVSWVNVVGHANTPRARNVLAKKALDLGADELVWIDDDIGFSPEAFGLLFDVPDDVRVVAGMPQRRTGQEELSFCGCVDREPGRNGRLLTGHAATAFLRVGASVLRELEPKVGKFQHKELETAENPEGWCPAWFHYEIGPTPNGDMVGYTGEDFWFSGLCRDNGIDVWLDPSIQLRHWHTLPLGECYGDHVEMAPENRISLREMVYGDRDPYRTGSAALALDLQGWRSDHPLLNERAAGASRVAEIGVWRGGSVAAMAKASPDAEILAVDTFRGSAEHFVRNKLPVAGLEAHFKSNMRHLGLTDRVTPLVMDSVNAAHVCAQKGVRFDLIHIDGGHDEASVVTDLVHWSGLLTDTGVIVMDDVQAGWPGVDAGIERFLRDNPDWKLTKVEDGKGLFERV